MLPTILLQIAVLMAGLTWGPVQLMFKFMNVAVGGAQSFYTAQSVYMLAIGAFYQQRMEQERKKWLGKDLTIILDTRFDTPGKTIHNKHTYPY